MKFRLLSLLCILGFSFTQTNVNGRLIDTIQDGLMSAGYHSRVWDGTNYSSGLYIVRMNSRNGFNSIQKIMLIK